MQQDSRENLPSGDFAAVIVAAGQGSRAGGARPKQYLRLLGRPVLAWSVAAFIDAGVKRIVAAHPPGGEAEARAALAGFDGVRFVAGGVERTESVRAGLAALGPAELIFIHDAARPGLTAAMVRKLARALAEGFDGACPALPVADSLRRADAEGLVAGEVDRQGLMAVQTPQAFRGDVIRAAYEAATGVFSDDIAVARASGARVKLIAGEPRLMKLTYPEDLANLEKLMSEGRITCVGHGFDAHRFGPGAQVRLCGVDIAHERGLIGHSDADAGWHALVDAILGALGEGDIGAHFPPSDPRWKGAASETFLAHAAELAARAGARILHVDITLICERPKIGPHREAMRARTAQVLDLPLSRVSVKATTTERLGFLGREEGLAAQAAATLDRPA